MQSPPAKMSPIKKMYMITRRDLTPGQKIVQTAHAMQEFMHKHRNDT